MTDIEKLAMKQVRTLLYDLSKRVLEHSNRMKEVYEKDQNSMVNIVSVNQPLIFITKDMSELEKAFRAFEIDK
jgi:hypothetical protein